MYDEGRVYNFIGMASWRLFDDKLNIHINLGIRHDGDGANHFRIRPYWGLELETAAVYPKLHFVAETFAGDPLVPNAPNYAMQTGVRYHYSNTFQFDLTFGAEPSVEDQFFHAQYWEYTAQLGLRILFDVFTRDGKPGNPEGAPGLWSSTKGHTVKRV